MNKKHKDILQKNQSFLVNNLTVSAVEDICDRLLQDQILTPGSKDTILNQTPRPQQQTRELLSNLPKRGPKAFSSFINALNETGNEFIVKELLEGERKTVSAVHDEPPAFPDWPDLTKKCSLPKDIQKTTEDSYREIIKKHKPDKIYSMTKKDKGRVIFLYNKCTPSENDTQTDFCLTSFDWDKTTLDTLFKDIGYITKNSTARNKSGQDMKLFLKDQMNDGIYDSLILVIISGGIDYDPSKIYDCNGDEVSLVDIVDIIKGSEAYKDKPKVVLLQTYSFKDSKIPRDELDSEMERLKLNKENTEDLFVVTSYPKTDYGPWMMGSNVKGSYFIQALAYVMKNYCHAMSFVEIMDEVSRCLSNAVVPEFQDGKETQKTTKKAVAEVAFLTKCLQREFFIFPGLALTDCESSNKGNQIC